jgi:hypothetical protein
MEIVAVLKFGHILLKVVREKNEHEGLIIHAQIILGINKK